MWFLSSGFGGLYDDYDDVDPWSGAPNRRNWNEKSQAALDRERQAKQLFDGFVQRCQSKTATDFPVTEEIVPASMHLTGACWTTFRNYVKDQGCKCKRREATVQERRGATRKGKMHVISVTVPVHPSQLQQAAKQEAAKAAAAAAKKKEKAEALKKKREEEARKRREEEAAYQLAVEAEYKTIMEGGAADSGATQDAKLPAVAAANKLDAATIKKPVVKTDDILKHAEQVYKKKQIEIYSQFYKEKRELEKELENKMESKKRRLLDEAEEEHKRTKKTIVDTHAVLNPVSN